MKSLHSICIDILTESEDIPNLIEFIYPLFEMGLFIYTSFNFDKYLRFGDLIETNAKLYHVDKNTSKKFLNTMMYKKSVDDFDDNDIDNIDQFISKIKNTQLFVQNIEKERSFLERNKNNYLLKAYFFVNGQTLDNEIGKCNYILESI